MLPSSVTQPERHLGDCKRLALTLAAFLPLQLSLHDVVIGEADPVTDPELLMTIMETREALEEAQTEDEVARIRQQNKGASVNHCSLLPFIEPQLTLTLPRLADARTEAVSRLTSAFATSPPDLELVRNLVIELRYLDNIDQVCREWAPGKGVPNLQH